MDNGSGSGIFLDPHQDPGDPIRPALDPDPVLQYWYFGSYKFFVIFVNS